MSQVENDEEDLTRKQRREQARANRKAAEEAELAGAARRRRLSMLGGAAAAVIVAVVVILIATSGGSKKATAPPPKSKEGVQKIAEVQKVIGGIPQQGVTLGSPTAPYTLKYFGDLECPFCKEFTETTLSSVIAKWVKPGKLRIEYRSLETATREPETFRNQQTAALAAGKQNKMWDYVELFYKEQGEEGSGYVTEAYLQGLARQIPGLNFQQWSSDRNSNTFANQLEADAQEASNLGLTGTPSFLIGKSGGTLKKFDSSEYGGSLTDSTAFNKALAKIIKG
jgi:protein-disulfide isomerase